MNTVNMKLEGTSYTATAYRWDGGSVDINISKDDGGWGGCGHPGYISLTRNDLVLLLAAVDYELGIAMKRGAE
jgi:hypothetical protein